MRLRCRWAPRYSPPTTTSSAVVARPELSNAVGRAATGVTRRNLKPSVVVLPGQRDPKGAAELRRHPRPAHQSPARVCDLADVHRPRVTVPSRWPRRKATSSTLSPASSAREATVCRNECIDGSVPRGTGTGLPRRPPRGGLRGPGVRHRGRHVAALRGGRVRRLRCCSGRPPRTTDALAALRD